LLVSGCAREAARAAAAHGDTGPSSGAVRRVVALAPDVTEMAYALGAGGSVVAVPASADFPPAARRLPHVDPSDTEAIVALRPDLVLATTAGDDPRVIARLRELGVRVLTADVTSFATLAGACRDFGRALGRPAAGDRLAAEVEALCARADAAAAPLPHRRALYVVWWDPLIVASPGTFHDDLLRRAGLVNLAPPGGQRYPRANPELLLDPRLEVVVAADEPDLRAGFARVAGTAAGARIASGAVRVIWLPADPASRPGPRLPQALEALVAARERMERPGFAVRGTGPGTTEKTGVGRGAQGTGGSR
jgi:ABC-type hemin transport system substrate-binding protein